MEKADKGQRGSNDISHLKYKTGIPTLRSSSHRVRYSSEKASKNQNAPRPKSTVNKGPYSFGKKSSHEGTMLPLSIRQVIHIPYDAFKYNLKNETVKLLLSLDSTIVGSFMNNSETDEEQKNHLEYFEVPQKSLTRKKQKGRCEVAQEYLSQAVASSASFLATFDSFVTEIILPSLKIRLIENGVVEEGSSIAMYYQRPPTLRLQPGPARSSVNVHKDSEYGHQPGELNYWIPLTDRRITGVDLFAESEEDKGDFRPLETELGFASSFHGSHCRHYVNTNSSKFTRASLDFRVGVEPFYDPVWQMIGTKDDHSRRKIVL